MAGVTDAAPAWLITARVLKGTLETPGSADNPVIMDWRGQIARRFPEMESYTKEYTHDSVAWCGLFAAYCVSAAGIKPPFGPTDTDKFLWANSWSRNWGTELNEPRLGCICVFTRNGGGHVAFYEGEDGDHITVTGGNQSDSVSITRMAKSQLTGYYWPPTPEKLPTAPNIPEWSQGKGSWYSQYKGEYSWVDTGDKPGSNALGVPDDQQGCSFYDRSTLGKWFDVQAPNAKVLRLRQTDVGPHPRTGRKIDIAAVAAERFGYTPRNFPTDSIFKWRPAVAETPVVDTPVTPTPTPPTVTPEPMNSEMVEQIADRVAQKMKDPKVKRAWGSVLMAGIKAAQIAFPQFAIFGSFAQLALTALGFMGTPMGEAATATGQITAGGLAALLASWAVSKVNRVTK